MTRHLGVACDNQSAYLTVADDGCVVDVRPERVTMGSAGDDGQRVTAFLMDVERALLQLGVGAIVIVPPEMTYEARYERVSPRIQMETLVILAAARSGIPAAIVPRATLRSRLGLPRKGRFEDFVSQLVPNPVGRYWTSGRGLAALGALGAVA
jgi:hypothetical protein